MGGEDYQVSSRHAGGESSSPISPQGVNIPKPGVKRTKSLMQRLRAMVGFASTFYAAILPDLISARQS